MHQRLFSRNKLGLGLNNVNIHVATGHMGGLARLIATLACILEPMVLQLGQRMLAIFRLIVGLIRGVGTPEERII